MLRRELAGGWACPSADRLAALSGLHRATVYRHLRRLEEAGAIHRERRRVEGHLRTGWTLAPADPVRGAAGALAPVRPVERVRAARIVERYGVELVRAALADAPRIDWHTRRGWRLTLAGHAQISRAREHKARWVPMLAGAAPGLPLSMPPRPTRPRPRPRPSPLPAPRWIGGTP
ncbi:helix-turn-helix domain-containing protein [Nannocystis bainbridge]|uniref:Helix-turn-helix domain-containing protein n=1 Tax=Nannocystis bainbridge TaxID=2995303 RepID=A0ABT5E7E3_9BACT|nr:helix-turn-helix domain-containing protein [Nannocystis bainbridge]MDC0720691.1 helix-turn-helix domain-containing protein [Nannocystis bainbridge]